MKTNIPKRPQKALYGKKKQKTQQPWTVRTQHDRTSRGYVDVDFEFLQDWLGAQLGNCALRAIDRFTRQYRAPTEIYGVRVILQIWCQEINGLTLKNILVDELLASLSQLRHRVFHQRYGEGVALTTLAAQWNGFLRLLPHLERELLLPHIDPLQPNLAKVPDRLVYAKRSDAERLKDTPSLRPQNYDLEADSYNETLLEPISISASDVDFLSEYEVRLEFAIDRIRSAALQDFEALIQKEEEAQMLLSRTASLLTHGEDGALLGNLDFPISERDPGIAIGLLLHLINEKMGGLPRAWAKDRTYVSSRPADAAPSDCNKLAKYGKNSLLPYLGIMTSEAALVCAILIILEHPQLNAESILRARITSKGGRHLITTQTVSGTSQIRLTTTKPRAGAEKSVILNPLARQVIEQVIKWTRLARRELRAVGDHEAAERLWVGMSMRDYRCTAFSGATITSGIRRSGRTLGETAERGRLTSFFEKHPELERWRRQINLKNLRMNMGILQYLRSGGDPVKTAQIFGHKSIQTTLDDYIPPMLKNAIYERQIRRHQNLLIASAFGENGICYTATDFNSVEELHVFLASIFHTLPGGSDEPVKQALGAFLGKPAQKEQPKSNGPDAQGDGRLVLSSDPKCLSVALLYGDYVKGASSAFLDMPDPATKVPPRFWLEFCECVTGDLPNNYAQLKRLVSRALALKPKLANTVVFPEIG